MSPRPGLISIEETGVRETFQIILVENPSGDGEIIFQYKQVTNIDDHGVTVGIESPDKNQGVEYLFNYSYNENASGLSDELSIVFSTQNSPLYNINGDVNQDSSLDVLDIIILVDVIIGDQILSEDQLIIADFNNDLLVDLFDVMQILQIIIRI